jgi:hypothetical protein
VGFAFAVAIAAIKPEEDGNPKAKDFTNIWEIRLDPSYATSAIQSAERKSFYTGT